MITTLMRGVSRARTSQMFTINKSCREWCALNNISPKTGRRILKAPGAPVVTMLTSRRIGITIKSDRDWKATRTRKVA